MIMQQEPQTMLAFRSAQVEALQRNFGQAPPEIWLQLAVSP